MGRRLKMSKLPALRANRLLPMSLVPRLYSVGVTKCVPNLHIPQPQERGGKK